jgi:arginase
MREIRLLVVPYELGGLRYGVGRGPERLLERGAQEQLAASGAAVRQETLELRERHSNEVAASFELMRMVSARVRAALREGAFPVVLSGSCCHAAVGSVAGLDEPAPGVVWFDAHGDCNTPATSPSGYLDGMGLPILTGDAWQALGASVRGARPLPETAIVLAGARATSTRSKPSVSRRPRSPAWSRGGCGLLSRCSVRWRR